MKTERFSFPCGWLDFQPATWLLQKKVLNLTYSSRVMSFIDNLRKMELIGEHYFPEYTAKISKYCDGDYRISVCYVPHRGFVHKFTYSKLESGGAYKRQLDVGDEQVIEVIEHPPPKGGLGHENPEEGECSMANVGEIDVVVDEIG